MRWIIAIAIAMSSASAHAGVCESIVTGLFTLAHNLFDRTGESYGFAKAKSEIRMLAASSHYHELPGTSRSLLVSIMREFQESKSVTPEEKEKIFEETIKIYLDEALHSSEIEFISNNLGYGNAAIMEWIIQNATEAAGKPGIQKLFVDAIYRLQLTDSMWTRIMLERVLLEIGAHPRVGFEPLTIQLFDRVALLDKDHLTSDVAILSASPNLRSILVRWRPRVELEVMRQELIPAFNEYSLKEEMKTFNRWLNGQVHNGLGLHGPNGYNDQLSMIQALSHVHTETEQLYSKNRLNNILHNVIHLRISLGIQNSDRAGPATDQRIEPPFVEPALQGALVIMSYMSQDRRLPEEEVSERKELIGGFPVEVQTRLLKMALELGIFESTEAFLKGQMNADPLREATADFGSVLQ